MTDPDRN
ncbi:unnamed protein product, partial [Rotaria sordida]